MTSAKYGYDMLGGAKVKPDLLAVRRENVIDHGLCGHGTQIGPDSPLIVHVEVSCKIIVDVNITYIYY
jgi:hypothetical protein